MKRCEWNSGRCFVRTDAERRPDAPGPYDRMLVVGTIFRPEDGYPDHRPIPMGWSELTAQRISVSIGVVLVFFGLCPKNAEAAEGPPRSDYQEPRSVAADRGGALGSTTTSTGPLDWLGNSDEVGAVVRHLYRVMEDHHATSVNYSSTGLDWQVR